MFAVIALLLAAAVAWAGFNPVARWKHRRIPGPFGLPFFGNTIEYATLSPHVYFSQLQEKYGPVFKVWMGTTPWVVICDAPTVRRVGTRCNDHLATPYIYRGPDLNVTTNTLFFHSGETWKLLKRVWDPALLHRSSLAGYQPLMQHAVEELVGVVRAKGGDPQGVDIFELATRLALQVVGTAAFGVQFKLLTQEGSIHDDDTATSHTPDGEWESLGREAAAGCRRYFESHDMDKTSVWTLLLFMMPGLKELWTRLAYLLPDRNHAMSVQALRGLDKVARKIIAASQEQQQQRKEEKLQKAEGARSAAAGEDTDGGRDQGEVLHGGKVEDKGGVLPGSFVSLLEKWRRAGEEGYIDDDMMVAQVTGFLIAGYETSANALAFIVHHLATHPAAERNLLRELDGVLAGRAPTLDDLPKLPYLEACIKEALRLTPPAAMLSREITPSHPPLTAHSHPLPLGTKIILFTYGLHHDPTIWPLAEEYLPERFLPGNPAHSPAAIDTGYVPFGLGSRMCTGWKFAMQELQLAVAALYQEVTFSPHPSTGPLRMRVGVTLAPVGGVHVLVHPRNK